MATSGFEGLLTGHTLADRYHVEEVIGRGGFAAVYRATDQRLGRTVAVKVITQSASSPELRSEIQRRFEREARAIAMLHHPNVVTVYDFGADPGLGLDFLVMELLPGEVLSDRLKRAEPIPVPEALRILRHAAWGVEAGHRAGLIHRDIKPGNIFLAEPGHGGPPRVVVLDFGIARVTEQAQETTQLTHSGRGFLSPAYASPEQLRGERPVTAAADVFSLGVIGYHLLAREKPFVHDRLHPGPYTKPPAPLGQRNPAVPAGVVEVIERAMRDDPAERYPDASAFVQALNDAVASVPLDGAGAASIAVSDATQLQPSSPEIVIAAAPALADGQMRGDAPAPIDAHADEDSVAAERMREDAPAPPDAPMLSDASVAADARAADEGAHDDLAPPPVYAAVAPVIAATVDPPGHSHPAAEAEPRREAEPPAIRPTAASDVRRDVPPAAPPPSTGSTRPARKTNPALFAIPALLAIAIALWLTMGRGGKGDRVAAGPAKTRTETAPAAAPPAGGNPSANGTATDQPATSQTGGGGSQTVPGGSQPGGGATPPGATAPGSPPVAGAGQTATTAGGVAPAPAPATPAPSPAARPPAVASTPPAAASAGGAGAMALNREGEAMFERGDLSAAIGRFRAAVGAAPGNAYYRNNLGWALFQAGRIDEAGRELNEAVRLDPRRDIAYANIGEVERARGNIPAAIAAYERFLQLNTDPRREAIAREKLRALRGG